MIALMLRVNKTIILSPSHPSYLDSLKKVKNNQDLHVNDKTYIYIEIFILVLHTVANNESVGEYTGAKEIKTPNGVQYLWKKETKIHENSKLVINKSSYHYYNN